jgi:hypothetical protein
MWSSRRESCRHAAELLCLKISINYCLVLIQPSVGLLESCSLQLLALVMAHGTGISSTLIAADSCTKKSPSWHLKTLQNARGKKKGT